MSDPTQTIPASEVDRIKRTAEETVDPMFQLAWIAGAKSEYLRREREVQELKDRLIDDLTREQVIDFVEWRDNNAWELDAREQRTHTTEELLNIWAPTPEPHSEP